ncbi:MAG: hypothetical protein BWY98_00912 [Tenericutes bacterium ADurb.BinA155]|nr:MAG: hypothetical protein BWY98_00912 [Tenericutes bacterium ADurb.BinA155]
MKDAREPPGDRGRGFARFPFLQHEIVRIARKKVLGRLLIGEVLEEKAEILPVIFDRLFAHAFFDQKILEKAFDCISDFHF